jgi:hypothetical protein
LLFKSKHYKSITFSYFTFI